MQCYRRRDMDSQTSASDHRSDVLQVLAAQQLIEPTQLRDIFPTRRLVRVLLQPSHHRIAPHPFAAAPRVAQIILLLVEINSLL